MRGEQLVEADDHVEVDEESGARVKPKRFIAFVVDVRQNDQELVESDDVNQRQHHKIGHSVARLPRHKTPPNHRVQW